MAQLPSANGCLSVRSTTESIAVERAVEGEIHNIDGDIGITEVKTMNAVLDDSLWRQRLSAVLFTTFAALAVVLAAAGIYAVFSWLVMRRTRETAIRIALGATRRQVLREVVGSALKLVLAGIAIGILAALLAGRSSPTNFTEFAQMIP